MGCFLNGFVRVVNLVEDLDLGILKAIVKSNVKYLGFIMDGHFKMNQQIISVIKSSFFQLMQLSKVKSFLSFNDFEEF